MALITDISQLDPNGTYTYADYMNWRFNEIVELIKGKIWKMSPAPLRRHQMITGNLFTAFSVYLKKNKSCQVYIAPFDVRLPKKNLSLEDKEIYTVVQPDICIICDESKLDKRGCIGVPDMIVEVLSPGNSGRDTKIKFDLYEEFGVKEYWIVSGGEESVTVFLLEDGKFRLANDYGASGSIPVQTLPGFSIEWSDIFT